MRALRALNLLPMASCTICNAPVRPLAARVSLTCCADRPTDCKALIATLDGAARDRRVLLSIIAERRAFMPALVITAIAPATCGNDTPSEDASGRTAPRARPRS